MQKFFSHFLFNDRLEIIDVNFCNEDNYCDEGVFVNFWTIYESIKAISIPKVSHRLLEISSSSMMSLKLIQKRKEESRIHSIYSLNWSRSYHICQHVDKSHQKDQLFTKEFQNKIIKNMTIIISIYRNNIWNWKSIIDSINVIFWHIHFTLQFRF